MFTLIKQQWSINIMSTIIWAGILGLVFTFTIISFPGEDGANEFIQALSGLPDSIITLMGDVALFGTVDGWLQMNLYSVLPLILAIYSVIYVNNIVCREIDTGSIEYTLSLPIKRWNLIISRFIAFATLSGLIVLICLIFTAITLMASGFESDVMSHIYVLINAWLVNLALGAVILFISIAFNDYNKALMVGIGLIFATYLLDVLIQASGTLEWLNYISIFYFFSSDSILVNGEMNILHTFILITLTVISMVLSVIFFSNKDLKI